MKTVLIGDRTSVILFSMAGVEGRIVESSDEAIEQVKDIKRSREYGLMIVTEQVALWAQEWISRIRFSKTNLLIVEIPDRTGHIETGKSLADYIREAVGIRI